MAPSPSPSTRTKVFISYSHKDKKWLERLQQHLKPLERDGLLDRWDDTHIKPGQIWHDEIQRALETARVAVLLVSADFLASDFIAKDELPPLLAAAKDQGTFILPVIVSASLFGDTPSLSQFQAVNTPDRPLNGMSRADQEKILVQVAKTIRDTIHPQ
jgi:hypothetical protein